MTRCVTKILRQAMLHVAVRLNSEVGSVPVELAAVATRLLRAPEMFVTLRKSVSDVVPSNIV